MSSLRLLWRVYGSCGVCTALVACEERFILFLRRLDGGTPEGEDRRQFLERNAAIAREAIQAIGGETKPRFVS